MSEPDRPSIELRKGAEPVPGYKLVRFLGQGGFGEVWEAEGPGGFEVALKFIRMRGDGWLKEKRSIEVIRSIRHPSLLTPFAAWSGKDWLILGMELARGTLADRLKDCTSLGYPGIPQDELLEYMVDAAKGIDYLNQPPASRDPRDQTPPVSVQHRDVKPQNLLLVGHSVKVADFGLARVMSQLEISHTGSMSFAYAAPEFFEAKTSPQSDQYSLAISYCELRGGRLPFKGNLYALQVGHLTQPPDLSMIPELERPIVARALAKPPGDRWPNCRAFVEALRSVPPSEPPPPPDADDPESWSEADKSFQEVTPVEETIVEEPWGETSFHDVDRSIPVSIAFMHEQHGIMADLVVGPGRTTGPGFPSDLAFRDPSTGKRLKVITLTLPKKQAGPVSYLRLAHLKLGIEWWTEPHPVLLRVYQEPIERSHPGAIRTTRGPGPIQTEEAVGFVIKGVFNAVIPAGSTLPRDHRQRLRTIKDNQRSMNLEVFALARDGVRRSLGKLKIRPILPARAGVPWIDCRLRVDPDGRFTLIATDPGSGQSHFLTLG